MPPPAIHPGEHLAEEVELPANRVTQILNGTRTVTGESWLNLRRIYALRLAQGEAGKSIKALPRLKPTDPFTPSYLERRTRATPWIFRGFWVAVRPAHLSFRTYPLRHTSTPVALTHQKFTRYCPYWRGCVSRERHRLCSSPKTRLRKKHPSPHDSHFERRNLPCTRGV
jgi:antitoxin HigA-1